MYKSSLKVIFAAFFLVAFIGCGVKTDPVAPESPIEVAPVKKKQDKEKQNAQ